VSPGNGRLGAAKAKAGVMLFKTQKNSYSRLDLGRRAVVTSRRRRLMQNLS
jgi:hypothetical protein